MPSASPQRAAARAELARVRDLQQIVRDINWSLIFDCLKYETFTPHAREVLSHASDDIAALLASVRGAEADTARLDWMQERVDGSGEALSVGGVCYWSVAVRGCHPRSKETRLGTGDDLRDALDAARAHPPTTETDDA